MKEEKNVSSISTFFKVLRFWLYRGKYSIPKEHHYNMMMGRGCSVKLLKKYFKYGHSFDYDAVIKAISQSQKVGNSLLKQNVFLEHLKMHSIYQNTLYKDIAKIKGVPWMLKNGFHLNNEILAEFFKTASSSDISFLITNVDYLRHAEEQILKSKNKQLIMRFIQVNKIKNENIALFLDCTDSNVLNTLIEHVKLPPAIVQQFIRKCSDDIALKLASKYQFDSDTISYIVDNNKWKILETQLDWWRESITHNSIQYISLHATDEFFSKFALNYPASSDNDIKYRYPDEFFERLFSFEQKSTLKEYASDNYLPSKFEIRLLSSEDEETKKIYLETSSVISNEANLLLLKSGNKEAIELLLDTDGGNIGYMAEAFLFKSGFNDYIKMYLKDNDSISKFSEAILLKFADEEIVTDYLENVEELSLLAFRALLERGNECFIKKALTLLGTDIVDDENFLRLFFELAPSDIIIEYFDENYFCKEDNLLSLSCEDEPSVFSIIFQRKDIALQRYILDHFELDSDAILNLVKYADRKIVLSFIKGEELYDEEQEIALFNRRDIELTSFYIDKYEVYSSECQSILLTYLDETILQKLAQKSDIDDEEIDDLINS